MGDNYFLNRANSMIGDSIRFIKQQQNKSPDSTTFSTSVNNSSGGNINSGSLSQLMMLMLFQLLSAHPGNVPVEQSSPLTHDDLNNLPAQGFLPAALTLKPSPESVMSLTNTETPLQRMSADSARQALDSQRLSEAQLGEHLLSVLHKGDMPHAENAADILGSLIPEERLNPIAFLRAEYLKQLSPERQELLVGALFKSGLSLKSGRPNSRLIGFMISELSRNDTSINETQVLLSQYLSRALASEKTDTPFLDQVIQLSGLY